MCVASSSAGGRSGFPTWDCANISFFDRLLWHGRRLLRHWLRWGAGPRAGQFLILAGKARALMLGRLYVTLEDIEAVAPPVLRHRLVPNFNAEA